MRPFKYCACFFPALCAAFLFSSCATSGTPAPQTQAEKIQAIADTIKRLKPAVQPFVAALMREGIDYGAVKAGADAPKIRADIQPIADKIARGSTLAAAAAGDVLTPAEFCKLLKVEDDNMTRLLQSGVPMYSFYYSQWKQDPNNLKIFAYSQCFLEGLSLLSSALDEATKQ